MTPKNPVPARLFVLLAREAHVGVILRRGPSDWVQMIRWDTKNDHFTLGQWFHGRIYEQKCDLSPNGRLFVYCAYKPGNQKRNPDYGDRWTAISQPPNFTALALWPHNNTMGGGGFFYNQNEMLLNHLGDNQDIHPKYRLPKNLSVKTIETYEDESDFMFDSIYPHVMRRDGWRFAQNRYRYLHLNPGYAGMSPPENDIGAELLREHKRITIICKIVNQHHWFMTPKKLRRILSAQKGQSDAPWLQPLMNNRYGSKISHRYEYKIRDEKNGKQITLDGATWADFDKQKRLVLAKGGKILSAAMNEADELFFTELADFNANEPDPAPSPDWAKKW